MEHDYKPKWYTNLIMKGPWAKGPVWLYRLRLGWLLDHRALMITHVGRATGSVRQTVVEVIRHDPSSDESIVVSGYGERSDWYQNVRSQKALLIDIGRKTYVPVQRELDEDERYNEITAYQERHPRFARAAFLLMGWKYGAPEPEQRRLAEFIRMLAFRPE